MDCTFIEVVSEPLVVRTQVVEQSQRTFSTLFSVLHKKTLLSFFLKPKNFDWWELLSSTTCPNYPFFANIGRELKTCGLNFCLIGPVMVIGAAKMNHIGLIMIANSDYWALLIISWWSYYHLWVWLVSLFWRQQFGSLSSYIFRRVTDL